MSYQQEYLGAKLQETALPRRPQPRFNFPFVTLRPDGSAAVSPFPGSVLAERSREERRGHGLLYFFSDVRKCLGAVGSAESVSGSDALEKSRIR
jgi:hypothetical protein